MKRLPLLLLTATLACRGADVPPAESAADPEVEPRAQASAADPADLKAIAARLRARDVKDLPSADDLERYPSAEASLQELARHGDTMVVRTRALQLLQHFGSDSTRALLLEIAGGGGHPALRAAAIEGLAGQPLDGPEDAFALVVGALDDPDPRVGRAAVATLDRSEAGKEALEAARARPDLSPSVRAAIDAR